MTAVGRAAVFDRVVIAVGRASVPGRAPRREPVAPGAGVVVWERPPLRDPWTARGLLWRRSCRRVLTPVAHPDGARVYSCGTLCGHCGVPAEPVERDLLLRALVRAAHALKHPTLVSAAESRRWRLANPLDSPAMLTAGFARVEVDDDGTWFPVWRHETCDGGAPVSPGRPVSPRHSRPPEPLGPWA